jgi:AAHS family 4-hydroxybenzoate transporter-like MFS transporter
MQRRDLPVTLDELLDARPLLRIQRRVLALVGGAILLEGFDIQTLGLCAPAILKDWHLARESLGPAMAAALVGMAVGASIGGQFGDRFGRRPVLVISIFQFGLCTLLTAAARNLTDIFVLRMLAGLAFGAALSNATALVAEWFVPSRSLKAVGSVIIGTPVGGMLGAALCAWLIPLGGWRVAVFGARGPTHAPVDRVSRLVAPRINSICDSQWQPIETSSAVTVI